MPTKHTSVRDRRGKDFAVLRIAALLVLLVAGTAAVADEGRPWRPKPALDLRTATYFEYSGDSSMTYPALGAELSIELSPPQKSYSAGLFIDYEVGSHADARRTQLIGGWISYRYGRWKLSTAAANFGSKQVSGLWMHATRLQFELRPRHRLAIEAIAAIERGHDPSFQIVYNTYLTERTSVSIKVGVGPDRMRDFGASAKYVWNLF